MYEFIFVFYLQKEIFGAYMNDERGEQDASQVLKTCEALHGQAVRVMNHEQPWQGSVNLNK